MSQMISSNEVNEMREALSDLVSTLMRVSPRCAELPSVRRAKDLVYRSTTSDNAQYPEIQDVRDWHLTGSD